MSWSPPVGPFGPIDITKTRDRLASPVASFVVTLDNGDIHRVHTRAEVDALLPNGSGTWTQVS